MEPSTNDILRDRGLALQAIACVDTAIWDVFGEGRRAAAPSALGIGHRLAADAASSVATTTSTCDQTRELIGRLRRRASRA